jgi:beta-xylosidase
LPQDYQNEIQITMKVNHSALSVLNLRNLIISAFIVLYFCSVESIRAQQWHSDNGDGNYTNPLIPADFPDPDVIRVGNTFYMVTTTMFVFPGVTILKSHDLVNWEYCSNAIPRFDFSPCYSLEGCNRYGHGQWATSLKYYQGKFYLLFITLQEG